MKKIIFQLLVLSIAAKAHAQSTISRTMKSSTGNRISQGNQNLRNDMSRTTQSVKFVPVPNKINFIKYRRVFSNANMPVRTTNTMDYKSDMKTSRQLAGTSLNNKSVSMTDRKLSGSSSTYMRSDAMHPISYSITRNVGGHKIAYFLTSDVSGWKQQPEFNSKIASKGVMQLSEDRQWNCQTNTISIDARSTSFMNPHPDQQASDLLPGMIYSFDDYSSGNFNQKYNFNRNPISLVSDVLNSQYPVSADIADPNMVSISGGISSIINQYRPSQGGSDYQIQATLTNNNSDEDIIATAGGSYGAFSGSNTFHHTQNDHHFYFTIDAVKTMYTINVQAGQNGFYKNGNIPSSNSPLVMIQSVTFGARVLANMDVEIKSTSDINGLKLKYDDGMESGKFDLQTLFANNSVSVTINGYLIGFPTKFPGSFSATKENFFNMIDQFFSGCDYQSAKPIQYNFVNMDGNEMGIASATDQFAVPECTPADEMFLFQEAYFTVQTGADNKNSDSEFDLYITGNGPDGAAALGMYSDHSTEYKSNSTNTFTIDFAGYAAKHRGYTIPDDFSNGGSVMFQFTEGISFGRTGDDWDISHVHIVIKFRSQKGTPKEISINIPNFRLSSGFGGPAYDRKTFYFNPDGSLKQ